MSRIPSPTSVRPGIRTVCGEARRVRSRLSARSAADRVRAIPHVRRWLSRTANRWPLERLRELARRELDLLAGCLYGVASTLGEEPQAYRRMRSNIGRLLGVPEREGGRSPRRARRHRSGESEIFGTDDRRLVTDTMQVPFRFICCLEIVYRNPITNETLPERGTGTRISDRHVLTAAHCVFVDVSLQNALLARMGRAAFPTRYLHADQILVAPARHDRDLPGDFSGVANVRVAPGWQAAADRQSAAGNTAHVSADPQADFALLTLRTPLGDRAISSMTLPPPRHGHWGHPTFGQGTRIRPIALDRLRGQPVNTAGYPTDKCRGGPRGRTATAAELAGCTGTIPHEPDFRDQGSTQWVSTDQVVEPSAPDMPGMITFMADTAQGQSGSPVWLRWQGFRNLVAINTGGYPRRVAPFDIIANMGVRITEPVLALLRGWLRADGVTPNF